MFDDHDVALPDGGRGTATALTAARVALARQQQLQWQLRNAIVPCVPSTPSVFNEFDHGDKAFRAIGPLLAPLSSVCASPQPHPPVHGRTICHATRVACMLSSHPAVPATAADIATETAPVRAIAFSLSLEPSGDAHCQL